MCSISKGWDKKGTSNNEMISGSSKEGAIKTCTGLGGGSSIDPKTTRSNTKDDAKDRTFKEKRSIMIGMCAKGAPQDYKAILHSQAMAG